MAEPTLGHGGYSSSRRIEDVGAVIIGPLQYAVFAENDIRQARKGRFAPILANENLEIGKLRHCQRSQASIHVRRIPVGDNKHCKSGAIGGHDESPGMTSASDGTSRAQAARMPSWRRRLFATAGQIYGGARSAAALDIRRRSCLSSARRRMAAIHPATSSGSMT